jgi:penicillin amidase
MRLVVSRGEHSDAILTVPGGQSGHPLHPNYADQFTGWADRKSRPLVDDSDAVSFALLPHDTGGGRR